MTPAKEGDKIWWKEAGRVCTGFVYAVDFEFGKYEVKYGSKSIFVPFGIASLVK